MTVPAKINIVTLGVQDLDRAAGFYASLGWRRSESSNAEIIWFVTAGSILGLFPFEHLAEDAALAPERAAGFGGVTLAINVPTEEEVQPALDAAAAAGGTVLKPATRADWGGLSGYFADPDGYPWEVAWNPFLPLDEAGLLTMP
jgi:catechol 2,3-dioxygenase-like lactoylglutathione lyase family enzyme